MTDKQLETKFTDLAEGIIPAATIRRVMDACWNVETCRTPPRSRRCPSRLDGRGRPEKAGMSRRHLPSRRSLLQSGRRPRCAGGLSGPQRRAANTDVTARLARYMVAARDQALPDAVARGMQAPHSRHVRRHGVRLAHDGRARWALKYVRGLGGEPQASVVGADFRTTAVNAALANAMCAHADETDDFEPVTKAHPGSSVVPAALAIAEQQGRSGQEFIRAVALGYDLGCRLLMALGPDLVRGTHRSAEGTASTFGALGAAASLARLDEQGMRFAISYAAQQVSGLWSWVKDKDHVEKAFDFAGMGARNGVMAVDMVQAGLTGVADVLDGTHNLFIALSTDPKPEEMLAGSGQADSTSPRRRSRLSPSAIRSSRRSTRC